jgi:hypothetical protein
MNMKTRNLLLTIGAVGLTVITLNLNASDALLSPRVAGNQIRVVPATAADQNRTAANQSATLLPRAAGNQIAMATGTANEVNPVMACRNMAGSPKTIQACAEHPGTMPGCNPVTIVLLK